MTSVFISFSSKDVRVANKFRTALDQRGVTSIFFSGHESTGIPVGANWEHSIYSALKRCRIFLPLISENWNASAWCHAELRIARMLGVEIIPTRVSAFGAVAPELQHIIPASSQHLTARKAAELVSAKLRRHRIAIPHGPIFPGLRPFDRDRASVFSGRAEELNELHNLLNVVSTDLTGDRTIIVTGPSGVGKSSLVRAGLLPDLETDSSYKIIGPVNASHIARGLGEAFAASLSKSFDVPLDKSQALVELGPKYISLFISEQCTSCSDKAVVIFVDQAELLLDQDSALFTETMDCLAKINPIPMVLVYACRDDQAIKLHARTGGVIFPLRPMTEMQLREALTEPLMAMDRHDRAANALVDRILRDIGGANDMLPLASFTMAQIEALRGGFTPENYDKFGGIRGAIERSAEEIWNNEVVPNQLENSLRKFFVSEMVSIDEQGAVRLGSVGTDKIAPEIVNAINSFVQRRILHCFDLGGSFIEPGHEALLREWGRLKNWLSEEEDRLSILGSVVRDARVWEKSGRKSQNLAHRGDRLKATLALLKENNNLPHFDPCTREYLAANLAYDDSESEQNEFITPAGYKILIGLIPFPMAIVDQSGRIIISNSTFNSRVRLKLSAKSTHFTEIIFEEDRNVVAEILAQLSVGPLSSSAVQVRLLEDTSQFEGVTFASIRGMGDAAVLIILQDNSEQGRLKSQVAQATKMQVVGQLAGGIAHDFNNMVTAILGMCDTILLRHIPGDADYDDVQQIRSTSNRAASLTRQLLAFSRQQTLRPQVLKLTDVVAEISPLLKRLLGEGIELGTTDDGTPRMVRADPSQLEQVIVNLAVNARDAMPEGGKLTLHVYSLSADDIHQMRQQVLPEGNYVCLSVSDTGVGIAPDVIGKIFEPFFTTKEVGKGTGLGLSTVYGIIKQSGGYIWVESVIGEGTKVDIFLPAHENLEKPSERISEHLPADLRRNQLSILVVEDEDMIRSVMVRHLQRAGYKVFSAEDGRVASERFTSYGKLDLIITDIVMPHVDGLTFIKSIKDRIEDTAVLYVSGYAEEQIRKSIMGDFQFLPKPFAISTLVQTADHLLARLLAKTD
jgi:signal transduction histidine kinase